MTLQELQRLSDEQLVEKLAVEVMGWEKRLSAYHECPHCKVRDSKTYQWWSQDMEPILKPIWCEQWNPLTSWDDAMDAVKASSACGDGTWRIELIVDDRIQVKLYRHDEEGLMSSHGELDGVFDQRAICFAALLAVSA